MAEDSFTKEFILDSEQAVASFVKAINASNVSIKIDRTLITPESRKRGALKIAKMLYQDDLI